MAQLNLLVGDIDGNTQRIIDAACYARDNLKAQLIVFPELSLTSYPPEDLLLRHSLAPRIDKALIRLREVHDIAMVVGYPRDLGNGLQNILGVFYNGKCLAEYAKQYLPNYLVFDEQRYFTPGNRPQMVKLFGITMALTICEDIWRPEPMAQAKEANAQCLININASPFHLGKGQEREQLLAQRACQGGMPIIYVNLVGGQDELVFDGGSMAVTSEGSLAVKAPDFRESITPVTLPLEVTQPAPRVNDVAINPLKSVYDCLCLGLADYVNKNGFNGVVLGLSGGIDSALTLCLAVDALGSDRVASVMMPFRYTSDASKEDAAKLANALGNQSLVIPIEPVFDRFIEVLQPHFGDHPKDTTEENLQARCRGVILMALSNRQRRLVLTTGNKSEMAVGYATLYGDMAGGFAVIKDVAKTMVFALARYRNEISPVIPERIITRPPSAELAPDQKDSDTLPPYPILDEILQRYVEEDESISEIVARGVDKEMVTKVAKMVTNNEHKRRQAPVGVRITRRAFGRDRRYPITSGWQE